MGLVLMSIYGVSFFSRSDAGRDLEVSRNGIASGGGVPGRVCFRWCAAARPGWGISLQVGPLRFALPRADPTSLARTLVVGRGGLSLCSFLYSVALAAPSAARGRGPVACATP